MRTARHVTLSPLPLAFVPKAYVAMPSTSTKDRHTLADRILKFSCTAMVACTRCSRLQKECRLSSLSRKCAECTRSGKSCQPAHPVLNFASIDRAMEKLEKEELETEARQAAVMEQIALANEQLRISQSKLMRLRHQKRFLREKEQKMFDKGLSDVEELERLEEMEKVAEVERTIPSASSLDDWFGSGDLPLDTMSWLDQPFVSAGTAAGDPGSSQGS